MSDERRLVTVLFADLVGFSGRAEATDPEQIRELQRAYFGAVTAEVERYGGSVEKYIGDAVMALFGVPQAHDDDAERALHAAAAIRDAVTALDQDLEVRIGVNTGEVVGGPGGPNQGEYSVSGDAVNVAARLQQSALPGEVLVGGTTRRLAYEAFDFAPRESMAVKGRTETVETWRLEAAVAERRRARGGEARLVGRERELASLESAIEEARDGRGLMVALVGEPGIGKSRLALELLRRAEATGFATAWTSSRSYASAFAYDLVGQLVPQLLRSTNGTDAALHACVTDVEGETLETWARVLDDVLGTAADGAAGMADLSPAGKQRILVQALGAVLAARSTAEPLLVVLDDLHWADPASLAVTEELLAILPELRVALVATYRPSWSHGWEGRSAYEQINLRPLRPDDARRMASELATGATIPDAVTEQVLERAGGNPLFLEELVQRERDPGSAGAQHRLPASIHEMLLARLDALPAEARRILQLAAVVGAEFGERIVGDLAETDAAETDDALRILQRAELVQARGSDSADRTFVFRHPLIHEVAYGSLLTSSRRSLHGRVGRWLEEHGGEDRVNELARHFDHSDDRDRARRYLRLAGERAHAINASREAFDWFRAAADAHADEPERRAEMLEEAAQEIYLLGNSEEASEIQREAIAIYESAGNDRAAARSRIWQGRYIWLLGDPEEAERQITLAVEGLERYGASPELAMAYSFRAQSLMLVPNFVEAEHWARKAIEVAEATGATMALVHATNNLGTCLIGRSDARGVDYLRRSRDLALEHHLADEVGRANNNLSGQGARIFPLPYAEMDRLLEEAIAYSRRTIPDGIFDRWVRSAQGEFFVETGRWQEAEAVLSAIHADESQAYLRGEVRSLRAMLHARRGRDEEAAALMAGITDAALRVGDLQAVLPVLATDATIRIGLGDHAGAVGLWRQAIERRGEIAEELMSAWMAFEAVDGLTTIFVRDPASAALRDGLELLSSFADRIAPQIMAAGDLVQVEVRQALLGAAVEQLGSLASRAGVEVSRPEGTPGRRDALPVLDREHRIFDSARIRLWLAEDGDPSGLAEATAMFDELRALPYLERAHPDRAQARPAARVAGHDR